jgi:hypothetical protein
MEQLRMSKSVRRVIRLEKDSSGAPKPVVLYQNPKRESKAGSPGLAALDRAVRRLVKAQAAFTNSYLSRHANSNRSRKDGWIVDLPRNLMTATRTGARKLKLNRMGMP